MMPSRFISCINMHYVSPQGLERTRHAQFVHIFIHPFEKWDVLCYRILRVYAKWILLNISRNILRILTKFGTQKHKGEAKIKFEPVDLDLIF